MARSVKRKPRKHVGQWIEVDGQPVHVLAESRNPHGAGRVGTLRNEGAGRGNITKEAAKGRRTMDKKGINRLIAEATGWTDYCEWNWVHHEWGETMRNPMTGEEEMIPDFDHDLNWAWPLTFDLSNEEAHSLVFQDIDPRKTSHRICKHWLGRKGIPIPPDMLNEP